jgi:hypothetical protein
MKIKGNSLLSQSLSRGKANNAKRYKWVSGTFLLLDPCGGGVEYLHRHPASRKRRRKGKSQIWDSKVWSWVPRDSDPRKTALARASSIYKRQTRPLVREGAPQKQDRNCQRLINIGARHQDLLTDWPSIAMWTDYEFNFGSQLSASSQLVPHEKWMQWQF